jgi:glycosyltransferase involved in cell wall biosynthesis
MWQHMDSFARNLLRRGYPVRLLTSPGYHWMNEEHREITHYSLAHEHRPSLWGKVLSYLWFPWSGYRRLFLNEPPSGLLVVSWHPMNFIVLRLFKSLFPQVPTCVWLHEPFKDEKKIYGAKAIIIYLVEWCQTLSLRYIDVVIVHSQRALRLFDRRYPGFRGEKRLIPLPFQDDGIPAAGRRRYISFLGRADRAKGIELFFTLVEGFAQNGLDGEFQIVTSSDIGKYLKALSAMARERLRVVNQPQISDKDLRQAAADSLAVLALYRETMQSGVIPVAWMKGTPVIGTDIEGITEWVRDRETGVIVSANPSLEEIKRAIDYIRGHLQEMTQRCRAEYLATFDDGNWDRQYGWLKERLSEGAQVPTRS